MEKEIDFRSEYRTAVVSLWRIVSYYDDPRVGGSSRALPAMTDQAKCLHESTMFGEARAVIARANDFGMNIPSVEAAK